MWELADEEKILADALEDRQCSDKVDRDHHSHHRDKK